MKREITQLLYDRITPPKEGRITITDKHLPGLYLRVSASGAKSWSTMYQVGGKQIKETLGTIPNVADARRRALESREKAQTGINPILEHKEFAAQQAANTVAGAVIRYLDHCQRDLKPKTVRGYRQIFEHDIVPAWGSRQLAEITKADVLVMLNDKAGARERPRKGRTDGAGVQANRVLTRLRTFFRWCVDHDLIAVDPSMGVRKPVKERAGERVLDDDELRRFWAVTERMNRGRVVFGSLFRLMLLTAQRETEVAGMRWSEIDLGNRRWTIPAARTKNGKPHVVHLSEIVIDVLNGLSREDGADLLFSGTGRTSASGFSKQKAKLDAEMGVPDWTLHDLRRTATTGMARLGIAPHVADRVLNHTAGTIHGVAGL